jgi:hypothetical protein
MSHPGGGADLLPAERTSEHEIFLFPSSSYCNLLLKYTVSRQNHIAFVWSGTSQKGAERRIYCRKTVGAVSTVRAHWHQITTFSLEQSLGIDLVGSVCWIELCNT